jgi:hypothetical protein
MDGIAHVRRRLDSAHVLGEVHARLHLRGGVGDPFLERGEATREFPGELRERQVAGALGLGRDQVRDRLRLGQVHASMEERAQRELTRTREPGTCRAQCGEHPPSGHAPAVARELHRVLARERARCAEHGRHHFVEPRLRPVHGTPGGHRPTVVERVPRGRGKRRTASEHRVGHGERGRTAHPHDRESCRPGGGGERRDGVVERLHGSSRERGRPALRVPSRASGGQRTGTISSRSRLPSVRGSPRARPRRVSACRSRARTCARASPRAASRERSGAPAS